MELWDDTLSGEGQTLPRKCAGGKEASVRTVRILSSAQVYQADPGWLLDILPIWLQRLLPPQWPTFTFPSNYTSWCTLIYSEHTWHCFQNVGKTGKETQSPRSRNYWPLQVWHERRYSLPFFRITNYIAVSPRWSAFGIKKFCLFYYFSIDLETPHPSCGLYCHVATSKQNAMSHYSVAGWHNQKESPQKMTQAQATGSSRVASVQF